MSRFASLLAGAVVLVATFTYGAHVAQAQVTPDGGTATGVAIAGDGRITVDIAPVGASQISRNTFTDFSVPRAGVDLNNTLIGARTILSEVTSTNRSFINGPVEIVGQRATFHPGQSQRHHRGWRTLHQYRWRDAECGDGCAGCGRWPDQRGDHDAF